MSSRRASSAGRRRSAAASAPEVEGLRHVLAVAPRTGREVKAMIRAIAEASGKDPACALAEIGARTSRTSRRRTDDEDMKARERLAPLKPDVTNVGGLKRD